MQGWPGRRADVRVLLLYACCSRGDPAAAPNASAGGVGGRNRNLGGGGGDGGGPAAGGMSTQTVEPTVRDRVDERPSFSLAKVKETTAQPGQ